MDKKIANNLIVGVFVIAGLGAFIFVLFTIGGGGGLFAREHTLKGKFTHVKGLNFGSEVSLMGLRVGTVKGIAIADQTTKELMVEFSVASHMMDKIRKDSVATIRTSGVLGDKYIEISIGSPGEPQLASGDFIPTQEPADLFSKTNNIMDDVGRNFTKGSNFDVLLANLTRVSVNLSVLTEQLKEEKGLWHELVAGSSGAKVNKATTHIEQILRKVNNGEGTLGALVNDPTVYEDLKAMMGGAKRSSILKYFMRQFIESGSEAEGEKNSTKKKSE